MSDTDMLIHSNDTFIQIALQNESKPHFQHVNAHDTEMLIHGNDVYSVPTTKRIEIIFNLVVALVYSF